MKMKIPWFLIVLKSKNPMIQRLAWSKKTIHLREYLCALSKWINWPLSVLAQIILIYIYFLVRLVTSLKTSNLHFFPPSLNSEWTFSCCPLSIFWLFSICLCFYVVSLCTRDLLCAVIGAASWSASRCSLGRNSCLPKKGRKDLTAQTSHLHQHVASVLPQHCPDCCFNFFLSLDVLPMYSVVFHCFCSFGGELAGAWVWGLASICIFHYCLERIKNSEEQVLSALYFLNTDTRGSQSAGANLDR